MKKLTAEVARMELANLKALIDHPSHGISIKAELFMQALEIALPVLEQQGGWISFSERMPELDSTILVHMEEPIHSATSYAVATYDRYGFSRSRVTHWQALPAPPLQESPTDTYRQIENDGWIELGDAAIPVHPETLVEIKMRNGATDGPRKATGFLWYRGNSLRDEMGCDIIAYRVIENNGREG